MSRPYIKVYIEELRTLARDNGLRRAEIGELVLLALGIDENNTTLQSKKDSARQIGMKSSEWPRRLQYHLKDKGVLSWGIDAETRTPRFILPSAFAPGDKVEPVDGITPQEFNQLTALFERLVSALERRYPGER